MWPRRVQPCCHRLKGRLWPAPGHPIDAGRLPTPARANRPRPDNSQAGLNPLPAPLCSASLPLCGASTTLPTPGKSKGPVTPRWLVQPRIVWRLCCAQLDVVPLWRATRILNSLGMALATIVVPPFSEVRLTTSFVAYHYHLWTSPPCCRFFM